MQYAILQHFFFRPIGLEAPVSSIGDRLADLKQHRGAKSSFDPFSGEI
jgi:hypothetical protein